LDIGQIEGAFIQGMGWCTLEEVVYADDDHTWIRPRGKTFTTGPGTYKIPAFNDVPEVFNVTLMDKVHNPFAIHSSKAVGEPPFFLGCSVFYAIKGTCFTQKRNFTDFIGYMIGITKWCIVFTDLYRCSSSSARASWGIRLF
jgi:xanthine dehydrogenase/oxidase